MCGVAAASVGVGGVATLKFHGKAKSDLKIFKVPRPVLTKMIPKGPGAVYRKTLKEKLEMNNDTTR